MRKKIAIALTAGVAAATVGLGAAGTASAAPQGAGKPAGITCMQFGLAGLRSLGAPAQVARSLGAELSPVLALHRNDTAGANALLSSTGLFDQAAIDAACPA
jgi:hypothetical protein